MAAVTKDAIVAILQDKGDIADSNELAQQNNWDHDKVVGIIKSLWSDGRVETDSKKMEGWKMTAEGEEYCKDGAPEARVFNAVQASSAAVTKEAIEAAVGAAVAKVGIGAAIKNGWLSLDKATKAFTCSKPSVTDDVQKDLASLASLSKEKIDALKKRKLVSPTSVTAYSVKKSDKFNSTTKAVADFTADMILKGTWKDNEFKTLNFNAVSGARCKGGSLHPLMKVRTEFRNILLLMGFEEMPTNQWVESSFWNFDTLYQPQQHPARDAHDTFFVNSPARTQDLPMDYVARVKKMHEEGNGDSTGWRYDWSEDEARKNMLRTHTTAVSARVLHKMAEDFKKDGFFTPKKYFSIDRVFRNETLDHTHLAEFHQVEFFCADRGLGLGHLIGMIREFFARFGVKNLRFKPAYNPYTEPSMEIFGWHPLLKKTVELGNSGVFRPEMLLPMGLPPDVTVIAGAIGLERTAARMYNIKGIRELFSHEQDVEETRKKPVAWLKRAQDDPGDHARD